MAEHMRAKLAIEALVIASDLLAGDDGVTEQSIEWGWA
jgi:hypothetical protein